MESFGCLYGYSLAFTEGSHELVPFAGGDHPWLGFLEGFQWNNLVGGFDRAFLKGMTPDSTVATFSNGVVIPEYAYMVFQMTFAMITPALDHRLHRRTHEVFGGLRLYPALGDLHLFSRSRTVFGTGRVLTRSPMPRRPLLDAPDDAAKAAAQANLDAVLDNAGNFFKMGALDFAGGTVVHINAGIAGFVGCLMLGKRIGYPHDIEPPHSVTMSMIGASLLWVGWFGFNAGSNLEATGVTSLAFVNTMVATAAATLGWMFTEWALKGKPSLLGMISGAVAGLVAVTPASGFAGPMGSIVLGFVAGAVCFFMCRLCEAADSATTMPSMSSACIALAASSGRSAPAFSSRPYLGGVGLTDYTDQTWLCVAWGLRHEGASADPSEERAIFTLLWSGIGSAILYKFVDLIIGLRPTKQAELEGLDITDHGERAYNP